MSEKELVTTEELAQILGNRFDDLLSEAGVEGLRPQLEVALDTAVDPEEGRNWTVEARASIPQQELLAKAISEIGEEYNAKPAT